MKKSTHVGIGFATGRKSFLEVLKTNIYNWKECGLTGQDQISLNLLVAYDLKYSNTKAKDYTDVNDKLMDLIDEAHFIDAGYIQQEIEGLLAAQVISKEDTRLFFTSGYAAKRNSILYCAVKQGMDYLMFLDDDEYPMAVTNTKSTVLWGGQHVLKTHLQHIGDADHCHQLNKNRHNHHSFYGAVPVCIFIVFLFAIIRESINIPLFTCYAQLTLR